MKNWNTLKERYLRDEIPIRLGNLASKTRQGRLEPNMEGTKNEAVGTITGS